MAHRVAGVQREIWATHSTHYTLLLSVCLGRGFQYKTYAIMNKAGDQSGENCLILRHVRTLEPLVGLSA